MKLAPAFLRIPSLVALLGCLAASCGTLETARVVSLEDIPRDETVWRPEAPPPEPDFLDTSYWLKRKVLTSLTFVPDVEEYVRGELTAALGEVPNTLPDPDAEYTVERALERWADRRAYQHRLSIRLATRRLVAKVLSARN
jgi:hypothetical protein